MAVYRPIQLDMSRSMTNIVVEFITLPSRQVLQANSFGFFANPAVCSFVRPSNGGQIIASVRVNEEYRALSLVV